MAKTPRRRGNLDETLHTAMESGVDIHTRTIFFFGNISEETVARAVIALEMFDRTEGMIRIVLSSPGGDVDAGFTLYDAIRMSHNPIVMDCYGAVQSMAVLILQAATLRRMSPECRLMIHQGSVGFDHLPTNALRDIAAEISRTHTRYCEIIAERSKLTMAELEKLCSRESFMSAQDAVGKGLADQILSTYNPMKIKIATGTRPKVKIKKKG